MVDLVDVSGEPGDLVRLMGITIAEVSADRVTGTMRVAGNTQPYGLLHGGASCVLAETLGSLGAQAHGVSVGRPAAVGVDINATHHKAVRAGIVTGVDTPIFRGMSIATYEIIITDQVGDRVCTARITCQLRRP